MFISLLSYKTASLYSPFVFRSPGAPPTTNVTFAQKLEVQSAPFLKKEQFLVGQGFQLKILMQEMVQLFAGMVFLDISLAVIKITMFIRYCKS